LLWIAVIAFPWTALAGSADPAIRTGLPASSSDTAAEYARVEAADDAAQAEVDAWMRENKERKGKDNELTSEELERRIAKRFEPVHKAYEDFLQRHPEDARARLAYGSFLNDRQDERGAQVQWEKALELDPSNPEIYNSLAGRYSESGPVNKAFEYFNKAIELNPKESAYYHNFGDSLYVLRKPATSYYGISEQQVFNRALALYSNAVRLAPTNFAFARDMAQTYYSLKPLPTELALQGWTNALQIAPDEMARQDVYVHLARVKMLAGRFTEARAQLTVVTNVASSAARTALMHNIDEREKASGSR
jgi:tetratricopeptide (TPR) repeat protein